MAQEGEIGEAATKFGEFALGAFDVVTVVAATSEVPAKVAKNVGDEFLEVVEFTSAAATKVTRLFSGRALCRYTVRVFLHGYTAPRCAVLKTAPRREISNKQLTAP